jgi:hypothetical protein
MPVVSKDLDETGALLEITVGWSAKDAVTQHGLGLPIPSPRQAIALVDTGAEITCIDAELSRQLQLPLEGFTPANLPAMGGLSINQLFSASLTFMHPSGKQRNYLRLREVTVMELGLEGMPFQALLGRDFLSRCRFVYDGPRNRFRVTY